MTDILTDFSQSVAANEANMCALMREGAGHWPTLQLASADPDVTAWFTGIPFPVFNGVAGMRLDEARADALIEEMVARGREAGVPLLWQIGPDASPDDMESRLEAHGFGHRSETPGMAARLADVRADRPAPPGLRIEAVRDADTLRAWTNVVNEGFGMPDYAGAAFAEMFEAVGLSDDSPLQNYVGWLDGEPASAATIYMGEGVVGLYNVATRPAARRRGVGAAVTMAALREGQARGYEIAILQSSEMGYRVYERMGFVENCTLARYIWMPY